MSDKVIATLLRSEAIKWSKVSVASSNEFLAEHFFVKSGNSFFRYFLKDVTSSGMDVFRLDFEEISENRYIDDIKEEVVIDVGYVIMSNSYLLGGLDDVSSDFAGLKIETTIYLIEISDHEDCLFACRINYK